MAELYGIDISTIAFKIVDAIEQSIQERFGYEQTLVTATEYKLANRMLTEMLLQTETNDE